MAEAHPMILCAVVLVLAMAALKLTVDGTLRLFKRTYVGATGARATRHLAYASYPVPTDRHYECASVDLEGRWDVLEDLAGAIGDSPKTTLAIKIHTGVIRYSLSAGAFFECPDWKLDGDVQRKLKGAEAESKAIAAACGKAVDDIARRLEATQAKLEATRAAYRKAEEAAKASEAATQHKLKELEVSHSQTCAALRANLNESTEKAAQLEASQRLMNKALQTLQAGRASDIEERDAATKKLTVANSLVSQLKGEVTQLEQRNQGLLINALKTSKGCKPERPES